MPNSEYAERFNCHLEQLSKKSFFNNRQKTPDQIIKLNNTIIKGRYFLSSVLELQKLCFSYFDDSKNEFYDFFLWKAANFLDEPTLKNYEALKEDTDFLIWKKYKHQPTACFNVYNISLGLAISGALVGIIFGTAVSLGPWGIAVIAVLGLAITAYAAYKLYQNARLYNSSQLNEIIDFVDYIKPFSISESIKPEQNYADDNEPVPSFTAV
ncbi:MAG: hypothetical protein H0U73_06045 [Tatlockia sp.]|nr:hypothetical protein [Tatlockia sp.]